VVWSRSGRVCSIPGAPIEIPVAKQPLSVRLPAIQSQTELGVFLAAMLIACLVPIIGFLIFQRPFLRGTGLGGAVKG
jgi:multiple sugar transport system permease protein